MADSPYPELKKTNSMPRLGRPWRDVKPPPAGPVWAIIQGFGSYWTLVAAVELGLFDAIESAPGTTCDELAARLQLSPVHLRHVLDALVTYGFVDQVDARYALTETAERYLTSDSPASMAALIAVAPGPHANWTQLATTVRTGGVSQPIEHDPAAFYRPLVQATFTTQHRAATRLGMRLAWGRQPGLRVLDLGAGCAPYAIAVLEQSPGSVAVVNDLPGVIDLARAGADALGVGDRVTCRPGDFLEIEIEQAAYDVVVLGHICRTEGDERSRQLVDRAFTALAPGGRILLADYFADDDRKANPFGVQMGLTMLANTERGGVLTHRQVVGWLVDAQFEHIRLIEPIGFNHVYVAVRPAAPSGSTA
jgi:SAM-dependent methyltransferase